MMLEILEKINKKQTMGKLMKSPFHRNRNVYFRDLPKPVPLTSDRFLCSQSSSVFSGSNVLVTLGLGNEVH